MTLLQLSSCTWKCIVMCSLIKFSGPLHDGKVQQHDVVHVDNVAVATTTAWADHSMKQFDNKFHFLLIINGNQSTIFLPLCILARFNNNKSLLSETMWTGHSLWACQALKADVQLKQVHLTQSKGLPCRNDFGNLRQYVIRSQNLIRLCPSHAIRLFS